MFAPRFTSKLRPTRHAVAGLLLATGLMTLTPATPVQAQPSRLDLIEAPGNLVDVRVIVDGHATPLFRAPGAFDRVYFQAFRGRNYSLAITNNTNERVAVLIAVDGLNVVSGERSSLSHNEPMYVLDPYESADIRGWRTSLRDIRKFVFVDEERSYAERSGQANGDMGWIRVLSFREIVERRPWIRPESRLEGLMDGGRAVPGVGENQSRGAGPKGTPPASREGTRSQAASPKSAGDAYSRGREDSNPGTGWGDRSHDPVNRTHFNAESLPTDHLVLRYEYERGLAALGINVRRHRDRLWEREHGDFGFAQPPKW